MITIRHVTLEDINFWFSLDKHLNKSEFSKKVETKQGYVIFNDSTPLGILRYNLFWDEIPFCNLLYIHKDYQRKGYGTLLMKHWEEEMKQHGSTFVLTSTQSDEQAQHFYRKIGYNDCGSLILDNQAMEIILSKKL